uniref:Uncharacterized protein n=1 Tax=viral metagenome TaxID=1070528 RepID=A0A6M3JQV8_9ZZZZ
MWFVRPRKYEYVCQMIEEARKSNERLRLEVQALNRHAKENRVLRYRLDKAFRLITPEQRAKILEETEGDQCNEESLTNVSYQ